MSKHTITFRLDEESTKALDAIATNIDRDRSYVLNEAVNAYIDVHRWQIAHIKEGVKQAQDGQFATDREVAKAFAKWRK